ncbi:MAG: hypothetical protein ACFFFG_14410 [Candidatus Thorarchaeota archaeon]
MKSQPIFGWWDARFDYTQDEWKSSSIEHLREKSDQKFGPGTSEGTEHSRGERHAA